eukprot:TRINITY_DN11029_c0_g1_i1.p1 TRINITY_DN11029_c0_g1~~TRINITY_DN11029_c0_g1_i1.p1  ORF type:complete len:136 (+),score=40.06 TRINITY_DN11029_c0_g1_i1:81-488(+)
MGDVTHLRIERLMVWLAALNGVGMILAGLYAFIKVKSKPSIIASSICGGIFIGLGQLYPEGSDAVKIGLIVFSVLMLGMFCSKSAKKGPPPEKMVSLLGAEDADAVASTSRMMFMGLSLTCLACVGLGCYDMFVQ